MFTINLKNINNIHKTNKINFKGNSTACTRLTKIAEDIFIKSKPTTPAPTVYEEDIAPQTKPFIEKTTIPKEEIESPTHPSITYEDKNENGKIITKLIETNTGIEAQTADGTTVYKNIQENNSKKETIYSITGKKLHETIYHADGSYTKTIFCDDEKSINSIIEFSSDDKVIDKKVINPTPIQISQETIDNLPKYIYHLTSVDNYERMKNLGTIKTSDTDSKLTKNGNSAVYLVDAKNLTTQWNTINKRKEQSLLTRLIGYCDKNDEGKIMMLKIPTSKLNLQNLTIRDQNIVLEGFLQYDLPKTEKEKYYSILRLLNAHGGDTNRCWYETVYEITMPDTMNHLYNGAPLSDIQKLSSSPLEYVYKEDIPFDIVENAKLLDFSENKNLYIYYQGDEDFCKELILKAIKK